MTLAEVKKQLEKPMALLDRLDQEGLLAAPVDLEQLFQGGVVEVPSLDASAKPEQKRGTLVTGSVTMRHWKLTAPVVVMGDVHADSIELESGLLVLGAMTVPGDVRGTSDEHSTTILGKVAIGRAIMQHQHIMQFLGGGTIGALIDDEGGADELIELLAAAGSHLQVKETSDGVP